MKAGFFDKKSVLNDQKQKERKRKNKNAETNQRNSKKVKIGKVTERQNRKNSHKIDPLELEKNHNNNMCFEKK